MLNFFKNKQVSVDVMDISAKHVATGQIGAYIKKLYKEEGFAHIGYRFENRGGVCRYIINTLPNQREIIQYFKDRCPAMVEKECRSLKGEAHNRVEWENGFVEVEKENWKSV